MNTKSPNVKGYKRVTIGSDRGVGYYEPPPQTIKFNSGEEVITFDHFQSPNTHCKTPFYCFKYIVAHPKSGKMGTFLKLTEKDIVDLFERFLVTIL